MTVPLWEHMLVVIALLTVQIVFGHRLWCRNRDLHDALTMRDLLTDDGLKVVSHGNNTVSLVPGDTLSVRDKHGVKLCEIATSAATTLSVIA